MCVRVRLCMHALMHALGGLAQSRLPQVRHDLRAAARVSDIR